MLTAALAGAALTLIGPSREIKASALLLPPGATVLMVSRTQVVVRGGKAMVTAEPSLVRAPTLTEVPLEKVRVALVMWSLALGRSCRTT